MGQFTSSPNASRDLNGSQVVAALVLVAVAVLFVVSLANGLWSDGRAPFPFMWRDVLLVHFLCAIPAAWMVAIELHRRAGSAWLAFLALVFLGISCTTFLDSGREELTSMLIANPALGILIRAMPALFLELAVGLCVFILSGRVCLATGKTGARSFGIVALVVLFLLPWTYVGARVRKDAEKLSEYLDQMRIGEARTLANGLLVLDADQKIKGRPLVEVAATLNKTAAELEEKVAIRPGFQTPVAARFQRAEQLAMLGRTDEAIAVLQTIREPAAAPFVANLLGVIYETREDWEPGLNAYRNALKEWESRSESAVRTSGIVQAKTGIAYCLRKSGRYVEAEAVYQELLALVPTADTRFLLAQFYEDAQQSGKAREHARRAMELAPDRYQQRGEKLINKIKVFHFGCFGVFSAEREQLTPPLTK